MKQFNIKMLKEEKKTLKIGVHPEIDPGSLVS